MPHSPQQKQHPVWEVYDLHRTTRLNELYWTHKLTKHSQRAFGLDVILAITAPGSAVTALEVLETPLGAGLWEPLLVIAALVAVVKPLLRLTEHIKEEQVTATLYRALAGDLKSLGNDISRAGDYTQELQSAFKAIESRAREADTTQPVH